MRPLILSGGPAAGKTTCGRALALERDRAAYIDVDDIRQLVVSGDATLWSGTEGEQQLILAARNVAALAGNFSDDEFDLLHRMIAVPPKADLVLHADHLTREQQIQAIRTAWTSA